MASTGGSIKPICSNGLSLPITYLPSLSPTNLTRLNTTKPWISNPSPYPSLTLARRNKSITHVGPIQTELEEDQFDNPPEPTTTTTSWDAAAVEEEGEGEGEEEEEVSEPPEEAKLFVGNLPYDVDSESLAQLFEPAGVVEISEVIYNRETDQSRGFGFVTMSTVEEADKAVEMFNRYDLNGRFLTVNKAAARGTRPERPIRTFEASFRIYVGNLPWDVDNTRLEEVFSQYGNVESARVVFDRETGRSRGFGFVTMSSEKEMTDAIAALDGQVVDGRTMRVNVAEERPRRNF